MVAGTARQQLREIAAPHFHRRQARRHNGRLALAQSFEGAEEERLVVDYRTTDRSAEIVDDVLRF